MVVVLARHPCQRVLVVDDNEDMLSTMRDALELSGVTVATATTQAEARRVLDAGFEPSVFLLDIRLRGGERGDDLAQALRADPRFATTPIVLVSGDVHELGRVHGMADRVLTKPFAMDRLFALLSDLCSETV